MFDILFRHLNGDVYFAVGYLSPGVYKLGSCLHINGMKAMRLDETTKERSVGNEERRTAC